MDETRTVPHLSAAEAEAYARLASTSEPTCCAGLAGTEGLLHDRDCLTRTPAHPAVIVRGRDYVAGEVPPALRSFLDGECGSLTEPDLADLTEPDLVDPTEPLRIVMFPAEVAEMQRFARVDRSRDQLLAQLLFTARNLAQGNITTFGANRTSMCLDCCAVSDGNKLYHKSTCLTGQTLRIIADLVRNAGEIAAFDSKGGVQ